LNYPAEIDTAFHCIQDKAAAEAYSSVPPFDEGGISRSPLCEEARHRLVAAGEKLRLSLSARQWELFQDYQSAEYEYAEYECMHFFLHGWKAGSDK